MVRTKMQVTSTMVQIPVPEEYIGKQIEVLLYGTEEGLVENKLGQEPADYVLDDDLAGSLKLTPELAASLDKHLKDIRNEWD